MSDVLTRLLKTEADRQAFAEAYGITPAQVKIAIETVGREAGKVLAYLRQIGKLDERALPRTEVPESSEQQAAVLDLDIPPSERSDHVHQSRFAISEEMFKQFLQTKLLKNHPLQDAYRAAQASELSEVQSLRAMLIAMVEANEVLERRLRKGPLS